VVTSVTPQDNQLMSKHRVLSLKPHLRLEWRGQGGQDETEKSDHFVSLGDSIAASTQTKFSVHTGADGEHQKTDWQDYSSVSMRLRPLSLQGLKNSRKASN
jgi:hypothetical protein